MYMMHSIFSILKSKIVDSAIRLDLNASGIYTFLNPYSYHVARGNYSLFSQMDGIFCDGKLLCMVLRLLNIKVERVSFDMTSLAPIVFSYAETNNRSLYVLGSSEADIEKSIKYFLQLYPNLNILGFRSGFFSSLEEREGVISRVRELGPEIVIVGMGTPLQEKFLLDLKNSGWNGLGFTCGGFLHQTSARGLNYYP